jgi:hypothetical protein
VTVAELIDLLKELDPSTVVSVLDVDEFECHVRSPLDAGTFTVLLEAGDYITEEDRA